MNFRTLPLRTIIFLAILYLTVISPNSTYASEDSLKWQTDYFTSMRVAKEAKQKLFLLFFDPQQPKLVNDFEYEVLLDPEIKQLLSNYVLVKLPVDEEIELGEEKIKLLEHEGFTYLYQKPGISIIDFASPEESEHYGNVISCFPFKTDQARSIKEMRVILKLPPGSLTQRTLIYAVRMHPEQPKSTQGKLRTLLAAATKKHSLLQARMRVQGHHHWDRRFQELLTQLPSDVVPVEVCAESWPGETLEEAAIECVRSWRHSSGHWSAVSAENVYYGYDLKRGSNGIWYATGIFAQKRK